MCVLCTILLIVTGVHNKVCFRDPIHTLCLGAILMYEDNADVFAASASAIFFLTADNGRFLSVNMLRMPGGAATRFPSLKSWV